MWKFFITVAFGVIFGLLPFNFSSSELLMESGRMTVFAEEDEDNEDENEDEDEVEDFSSSTETITRIYTVVEQVEKTIMVTPPEYLSDKDNDRLVDALDPNPDVHQREFFTDDDGDSVTNAYDRFPEMDDFVTFESETDDNANGIIDRYEY